MNRKVTVSYRKRFPQRVIYVCLRAVYGFFRAVYDLLRIVTSHLRKNEIVDNFTIIFDMSKKIVILPRIPTIVHELLRVVKRYLRVLAGYLRMLTVDCDLKNRKES